MPNIQSEDIVQAVHQRSDLLHYLDTGDFYHVLTSTTARILLGWADEGRSGVQLLHGLRYDWAATISQNIEDVVKATPAEGRQAAKEDLRHVGVAALHAFLQSNVTGPPLEWNSVHVVFPPALRECVKDLRAVRAQLIRSLTVDGETTYKLTPSVELFCLAKIILNHHSVSQNDGHACWDKLRVNFWHQRMLSEISPSLQQDIYHDLHLVDTYLQSSNHLHGNASRVLFLLERAAINTYHGLDIKARDDLEKASRLTGFEYVLTGHLGKRTKFQENELSQLVVLARSSEDQDFGSSKPVNGSSSKSKPQALDLNDDTLLESIAFSDQAPGRQLAKDENLPLSLASLDPANQPPLKALDSIVLLSLASSITNTSPQHGLTREETLPYATRVLEGGSTNWQIYTQALLVRSRIEGYRTRTVERGVLQLQALVDQIIAETTSPNTTSESSETSPTTETAATTTFLQRPKPSESAPVTERLKYIHQLASPTRWTLEAELAARWVSLGGLRTALEIYERLEMWAEAALCWAAVEREDKARVIVRRQLYSSTMPVKSSETSDSYNAEDDSDEYLGEERYPLPLDAPRLLCILGDIEKSPTLYERAWVVSTQRYARAQRSLGQHYLATKHLKKADEAYSKALNINPQNQRAWFALGCVRLELRNWTGAVDAFSRTVQIEDDDAEAWSNLAAALLRLPPDEIIDSQPDEDSEDLAEPPKLRSYNHITEAFVALKRAAALKRDSYRIWQNLLNVAGTLSPPPYADIIIAQERLIELRGSVEGENCVDIEVMEGLLGHVIAMGRDDVQSMISVSEQRREKYGLDHMVTELIQKRIVPLITHSRRLWQLVARLDIHLKRSSSALEAYEKAWRATQYQPGWDSGFNDDSEIEGAENPETAWDSVVDATIDLVDAYESLGERERTEGLAAGTGELVCKQWRFKSSSAIKGVMRKARERWQESEGWNRLEERMTALNST